MQWTPVRQCYAHVQYWEDKCEGKDQMGPEIHGDASSSIWKKKTELLLESNNETSSSISI